MKTPAAQRAELDEARIRLNAAIAELRESEFASPVSSGNWTILDMIVHIAAWDLVGQRTVDELAGGQPPTWFVTDVDGFNHWAVEGKTGSARSPTEALADLATNRALFLRSLDRAPAAIWHTRMTATSGDPVSIAGLLGTWTKHDHEHAAELEAFMAKRS